MQVCTSCAFLHTKKYTEQSTDSDYRMASITAMCEELIRNVTNCNLMNQTPFSLHFSIHTKFSKNPTTQLDSLKMKTLNSLETNSFT